MKITYRKPEIVDLTGIDTFGACNESGSGDATTCLGDGNGAGRNCAAHGISATETCLSNGNGFISG